MRRDLNDTLSRCTINRALSGSFRMKGQARSNPSPKSACVRSLPDRYRETPWAREAFSNPGPAAAHYIPVASKRVEFPSLA